MDTRHTILQVPFNGLTPESTLDTLMFFLRSNRNHLVVTPNPEAVMLAQRNETFLNVLKEADLVLPDGIGILLAAKWLKIPIPARVPGCDITLSLLKAAKNHSCYLLGAAPGVADNAMLNLQHQGINVLGARDGYFDEKTEKIVLEEIHSLKPDILLVGMGMPQQEEWTMSHLHTLPCKVTLCVGGTIDVLAGNVRRAPKILRRLGLEWLYRLAREPKRARRMLELPRFVVAVFREGI